MFLRTTYVALAFYAIRRVLLAWGLIFALQAPLLRRAIWEAQFPKLLFCVNLLADTISRLLVCVKVLGKYSSQGIGFVSSYWEITIPGLMRSVKLLGNYNFPAPVLHQTSGGLQLLGLCSAASYLGVTNCRVLRCSKLVEEFHL